MTETKTGNQVLLEERHRFLDLLGDGFTVSHFNMLFRAHTRYSNGALAVSELIVKDVKKINDKLENDSKYLEKMRRKLLENTPK